MAVERRKFLQQVAGFFGGGLLARLGIGTGIAATAAVADVAKAAARLEFSGPKRMTVPVQIESQFRTKANGDSGANRIADKMVPTI